MNRLPQSYANARIRRERARGTLSRLVLLLFCAVGLTGGFLFAAKQHFAAIQYGYKTEELRREHERLQREQQQLLLEKEQASSPAQLEPAARAIGLQPVKPGQVAINPSTTPSLPAAGKSATTPRR